MGNIIFLDLDGPMIPNWGKNREKDAFLLDVPFWTGFAKNSKQFIADLVDSFGAKIVVNSTHNSGMMSGVSGSQHIKNVFKANGMLDMLHTHYRTPFQNYDDGPLIDRDLSVSVWISKNGMPDNYVIFDDEAKNYKQGMHGDRLVQTGYNGLTHRNWKKARSILGK